MKQRSVTLVGTLHGPIWMPSQYPCQMEVSEDISGLAARMVNTTGSGLVDAVKSVVDHAGDFRSAKLTADTMVRIAHRIYRDGKGWTENVRFVDVTDLPSLSDHVDADAFTFSYE